MPSDEEFDSLPPALRRKVCGFSSFSLLAHHLGNLQFSKRCDGILQVEQRISFPVRKGSVLPKLQGLRNSGTHAELPDAVGSPPLANHNAMDGTI